jgi:hypothetical protein
MTTSYREDAARLRAHRGTGSLRERSPGAWEIRVVVGFDGVRGRSVQRSFTVHGDADYAEQRRRVLVDDHGVTRVDFAVAGARLTVGELLERFFDPPHLWKPATVVSHRPVVRALIADPFARRRLIVLTAGDVRAAIWRWQGSGASVPTVSAVGWCCARRCRGP